MPIVGDFAKLARLQAQLRGVAAVPQLAANEIARRLAIKAHTCFGERKGPDGTPWAPAKDGHRRLLRETGEMEHSIEGYATGAAVVLEDSDPKAHYHQHGTADMPARPFFPAPGRLPERWRKSVASIPGQLLRAALKGAG